MSQKGATLNKSLKYSSFILGLAVASAFLLAVSAHASEKHSADSHRPFGNPERHMHRLNGEPATAPEVDPTLAASALTLLAGTVAVARSRRQSR